MYTTRWLEASDGEVTAVAADGTFTWTTSTARGAKTAGRLAKGSVTAPTPN